MKRRFAVPVGLALSLAALLAASSCSKREPEEAAPAAAPVSPAASAAAPTPAEQKPSSTAVFERVNAMTLEQAEQELLRTEKQLGNTVELDAPDCDLARSLRDRICDLSARICTLTQGNPDSTMIARCTDGKQRCDRARQNVGSRCP